MGGHLEEHDVLGPLRRQDHHEDHYGYFWRQKNQDDGAGRLGGQDLDHHSDRRLRRQDGLGVVFGPSWPGPSWPHGALEERFCFPVIACARAPSTEAALKSSDSVYAYVFYYSCIVRPCFAKRYWIAGRGSRRRQEAAVVRLFAAMHMFLITPV